MKETLEKLWTEYLEEDCATFNIGKERELANKSIREHKTINGLLTKEQSACVEEYIDTLLEIESLLVKKAFFKGCEFTASFLLEVGVWKSNNY